MLLSKSLRQFFCLGSKVIFLILIIGHEIEFYIEVVFKRIVESFSFVNFSPNLLKIILESLSDFLFTFSFILVISKHKAKSSLGFLLKESEIHFKNDSEETVIASGVSPDVF